TSVNPDRVFHPSGAARLLHQVLTRRNCHYDWYKNRGQITRFIVHRHVTVEEPCSRIVRNHVRNRGHWGEAISVLHLPPQKRSPRRIMCRNLWASNSDTARSRDTRGADKRARPSR